VVGLATDQCRRLSLSVNGKTQYRESMSRSLRFARGVWEIVAIARTQADALALNAQNSDDMHGPSLAVPGLPLWAIAAPVRLPSTAVNDMYCVSSRWDR
jgi:hypothetical protein